MGISRWKYYRFDPATPISGYSFSGTVQTSAPQAFSYSYACSDTDKGALDSFGDGCTWYSTHPDGCGLYDDDDFSSIQMCCACVSASFKPGDFGSSYSYSHSGNGGPDAPACVHDCSIAVCLADGTDTCLDDCSFSDMQALCSPQMAPMMCQMNGYDPAPITQMCSAILSSTFSLSYDYVAHGSTNTFSYCQRPTYSTYKVRTLSCIL